MGGTSDKCQLLGRDRNDKCLMNLLVPNCVVDNFSTYLALIRRGYICSRPRPLKLPFNDGWGGVAHRRSA